jgi:predicted GNAT superfamily acetyltransferase
MVILIIKPISNPEHIKAVADVEAETWGMKPGDTVPDHVLTGIANEGGVLLGAYDEDRLIGFTLGWLGTVTTEEGIPAVDHLKLVSHMTGVLAGYRDQRIGYHLKLAQRVWALERGLDLITWTYDPLESRNAYLNIYLLGCTCQTYYRDYYGEMSDEMNEGIPSDRFRVDWWIRSGQVEEKLAKSAPSNQDPNLPENIIPADWQILNPARHDSVPLPIPSERPEPPQHEQVLVEIPTDIQSIRQQDHALALSWRIHTRDIFEEAFSGSFQIVDLIYIRGKNPRSYYLLEKES